MHGSGFLFHLFKKWVYCISGWEHCNSEPGCPNWLYFGDIGKYMGSRQSHSLLPSLFTRISFHAGFLRVEGILILRSRCARFPSLHFPDHSWEDEALRQILIYLLIIDMKD